MIVYNSIEIRSDEVKNNLPRKTNQRRQYHQIIYIRLQSELQCQEKLR